MRLGTFTDERDRFTWRPALFLTEDLLVDIEAALASSGDWSECVALSERAAAEAPYGAWWVTETGREACRLLGQRMSRPTADRLSFLRRRADVRLGPPVPRPGKMLAVGRNYDSHVREGQAVWAARGRAVERPPFPSGFAKFASALVGDGAALVLPAGVEAVDYELELAVVIGRHAHRVDVEQALSHVAGYTIANDVSARQIQLAEMEQIGILLSKNFPTFAPMGPWLVTGDELDISAGLAMELRVNGDTRQRAHTTEMLYSVAEVVADWSRIGLDPGDVILTGTPAGVALSMPDPDTAYLKDGDLVEAFIEGIGWLRNPVREETATEERRA